MPEPLKRQFREQVLDHTHLSSARLERLMDFLSGAHGLGMSYEPDAHHTVAEANATREANCMNSTPLTVALAREAGLDAYAQQAEEPLGLATGPQHALPHSARQCRGAHPRAPRDRRPGQERSHHPQPTGPIGDNRLIAHYCNNRAAALLEHGSADDALRHAAIALRLVAGYATSGSDTRVMHLRGGDDARAGHAYRRAVDLDPDKPGTLLKLVSFHPRTGDAAAACALQKRLDAVQARDPFHYFLLAASFERDGDFEWAASRYRTAIRLYDGKRRFHFGLARAYFLLGDMRRAGKALARERALSQSETWALMGQAGRATAAGPLRRAAASRGSASCVARFPHVRNARLLRQRPLAQALVVRLALDPLQQVHGLRMQHHRRHVHRRGARGDIGQGQVRHEAAAQRLPEARPQQPLLQPAPEGHHCRRRMQRRERQGRVLRIAQAQQVVQGDAQRLGLPVAHGLTRRGHQVLARPLAFTEEMQGQVVALRTHPARLRIVRLEVFGPVPQRLAFAGRWHEREKQAMQPARLRAAEQIALLG